MTSSLWLPTREETVSLLSALVACESINPSLVPGGVGESAIAGVVGNWLRSVGCEVEVTEVAPGRPNVIARLVGAGSGRSLLLNAHVDTVGVEGMEAPFRPRVEGDRLYGRGAYDMKGGLAAIMLAVAILSRRGRPVGEVIVTAVADEEYASLGTEAVVQTLRADGAVVTEPTGLRLCAAHKGFAWMTVQTRGRAAHGSKPDLGVDAIAHMGRVLTDLEALGTELAGRQPHPLLGTGSIHASLIQGGQELSSYPERCRLQLERRTVPGESPPSVLAEVSERLEARARADETFQAHAELTFWRDPFEVSTSEPIVQAVTEAATEVQGSPPQIYGDSPWMDAALLVGAGIPTVVIGPGGEGAHATTEWVSISEVEACAEILARTAIRFCAG